MREFNAVRAIYYGRNGWAAGAFRDRIREVLPALAAGPIGSINDAIEAHQSKLTLEDIPELFDTEELPALLEQASKAFGNACRYANTFLPEKGIIQLYDELEQQYAKQFWELLGTCGAEKNINGDELKTLLAEHPHCLGPVLEMPAFVKRFDQDISKSMMEVPRASAELIISALATDSRGQQPIHLPPSLASDDVDSIMLAYLDSEHPNPNYVEVLTRWPDRLTDAYHPSPEVRAGAKRVYGEGTRELFADGGGIRFSTGVTIDMNQRACRGVIIDGLDITYSFGGQWLEEYMDSATVMNNCRWVFDFIDDKGLMQMPAHAHEESGFVATLGPHVCGEYRDNMAARQRQSFGLMETQAYADFLERRGRSLEETLEWVYGTYFPEEYGIDGFGISLPSRGGTWLDRCKGIGPEIERAMKEYQLYARRGSIEEEYFPYEQFKSFGDAQALVEGKYAVAGVKFLTWAGPLFSDQSLLAYVERKESDAHSFYDLMLSEDVTKADYQEPFRRSIEQLIEKGLIKEDSVTGKLTPTQRAACLHIVWDSGAIVARRYGGRAKEDIESLVSQGLLKYHDGLFTPDEASYLNYMLNDSEQINAIGLRNKYSHADSVKKDPDANSIRSDYHMMLALLISITLKINDELVYAKGRPGGIEFVDWPFYDESVYKTASQLVKKDLPVPQGQDDDSSQLVE